MRGSLFVGSILMAVIVISAASAIAQQDEGPVLMPKPKAKPAGATLLVMCDLACNWKLDGEAKGHIDAGGSIKAKVELGQHIVVVTTEDGVDQVKQLREVRSSGQTVMSFEFQPVRDARLKAEQEARNREAREQIAPEEQEKQQQERERQQQEQQQEQQAPDCANDACTYLGLDYEYGLGVAPDITRARILYKKGCDGKDWTGCRHLAALYKNGQGLAQDYTEATALYREACDGGDLDSCETLGLFYKNGLGVAQNYTEARIFYKKACDGKIQPACVALRNLP